MIKYGCEVVRGSEVRVSNPCRLTEDFLEPVGLSPCRIKRKRHLSEISDLDHKLKTSMIKFDSENPLEDPLQ